MLGLMQILQVNDQIKSNVCLVEKWKLLVKLQNYSKLALKLGANLYHLLGNTRPSSLKFKMSQYNAVLTLYQGKDTRLI